MPTRFTKWLDGRPSHEALFVIGSSVTKRNIKLQRGGLLQGICPCTSCRAWEIVDGKFESVLKELCDDAQSELLRAIVLRSVDGIIKSLSPEDLSILMSDYVAGTTYLQAVMAVRLAWAKSLPWI